MKHLLQIVLIGMVLTACGSDPASACQMVTYQGNDYTICAASTKSDIRLFLNRPNGKPLSSFEAADAQLAQADEELVFAMNAGMYHADRSPVGLYIEDTRQLKQINTAARDGNFGLVPNGVFFINQDGAGVLETGAFVATSPEVDYATQSGPMLVIDGALHPAFTANGVSKKKRNGVGISADGEKIYFVISEKPVNFYSFATVFRDHLETPNALFLDGTVSRLYYPEDNRSDPGLAMGPMIGLVGKGG